MPLYRGHVEISSGQVYYGHTEVEDGYQQVAKFYENDPNITVTLNVIDNITGGTQYTVGGDLTGATSTGLAGQSYAFNTTVTADSGDYFNTGPTITNESGTDSTSKTVNTTLAGNVAQIPPNQCVATAVVQNSVTNGSGSLSFTTTPPSGSRACPNTLQVSSDFSTTATITDSNYDWSSGPSFSYPTNLVLPFKFKDSGITDPKALASLPLSFCLAMASSYPFKSTFRLFSLAKSAVISGGKP